MKPITWIASAVCAFALNLPAHALQVGDLAPDFELPGRNETVKLSQFRGKTVYLDFWASWCSTCKQSFPWMNGLQNRWGKQGLQVIAINVDEKAADAQTFLQANPAQFSVAFDAQGQTPKRYAIMGMPSSVLIGPDGRIISQHTGFRESQVPAIEQKIQQALPKKDAP